MKDIIIQERLVIPKKLKVVANGSSNGINTSHFSPDSVLETKLEIRKELGIPEEAFVFVFVGRMVGDKGINELVEASVELYGHRRNMTLLLVGPFEDELDPLLPQNKEDILHHEGIRFMDYQTDVRPYLKASDALVFPSYREGFPNVVMQAGAMGLPSIVTNINGCNEIIIEGKNGKIIPSKDKEALYNMMGWFLDNPMQVKAMADNARRMIASRYEQQMVWDALLEEYRSQIENY